MSTIDAAVKDGKTKSEDAEPTNDTPEHHSEDNSVAETASANHGESASSNTSQGGRGGEEIDFWACVHRSMPYTFGSLPEPTSSTDNSTKDVMLLEAKLRIPPMHNPASAQVWTRQARTHLFGLIKKYKRTPPALKRELSALKGLLLLARRSYVSKGGKLVFRRIYIVRLDSYLKTAKANGQPKDAAVRNGTTPSVGPTPDFKDYNA